MASERVAVLGSGALGTALGKLVATNSSTAPEYFDEVKIWVYEEMLDGVKLTHIFNTEHENVKYLPGVRLPVNLVAVADLEAVVENATLLIFALPTIFLDRLLPTIRHKLKRDVRILSAYDGFQDGEFASETISKGLGKDVNVSVFSGTFEPGEILSLIHI